MCNCLADAAARADASPESISWSELPRPLVQLIFSQLDATSLALAACTSQEWRMLATDDHLWLPLIKEDRLQVPGAPDAEDACKTYRRLMASRQLQYQRAYTQQVLMPGLWHMMCS